ncbi:Cryptochrome-1 [Ancistrocladus abbreviatus]
MWQHEAASRAAIENGTEEGLGDSSESAPIAFPQDLQMELDHEPLRNNQTTTNRHYEDQMVPSITSSLIRFDDEETTSDVRNSVDTGRAEVPRNVHVNQEREPANQGVFSNFRSNILQPQFNFPIGLQNAEESTAESSSSSGRGERSGGVVPVWSPSTATFSEQFVSEENGLGPGPSYLQRHPQSHQLVNWRRLSQTG